MKEGETFFDAMTGANQNLSDSTNFFRRTFREIGPQRGLRNQWKKKVKFDALPEELSADDEELKLEFWNQRDAQVLLRSLFRLGRGGFKLVHPDDIQDDIEEVENRDFPKKEIMNFMRVFCDNCLIEKDINEVGWYNVIQRLNLFMNEEYGQIPNLPDETDEDETEKDETEEEETEEEETDKDENEEDKYMKVNNSSDEENPNLLDETEEDHETDEGDKYMKVNNSSDKKSCLSEVHCSECHNIAPVHSLESDEISVENKSDFSGSENEGQTIDKSSSSSSIISSSKVHRKDEISSTSAVGLYSDSNLSTIRYKKKRCLEEKVLDGNLKLASPTDIVRKINEDDASYPSKKPRLGHYAETDIGISEDNKRDKYTYKQTMMSSVYAETIQALNFE